MDNLYDARQRLLASRVPMEVAGTSEKPPAAKWDHVPMFVPTNTNGYSVIDVSTRQTYLDLTIDWWTTFHLTRAASVFAGTLALIFAFSNVLVAAVLALVAGFFYGWHMMRTHDINELVKNRYLLEGT